MIKYKVKLGNFIKPCPCSPEVTGCGYYNLNLHTGCEYSCSYCILQQYLPTMEPVFFSNIEQVELELLQIAGQEKYLRIGTGELSDSLAFDYETEYSKIIMKIFEKFPQLVFEFKTKSANVKHILNYPKVLKNIVVSWSLNPVEIITSEEKLAPPLDLRLRAMDMVVRKGYKVGIHFDPLIILGDWKYYYTKLVKKIAQVVPAASIAWWSLGALRFPYQLRDKIFKHCDSKLFQGELIKGLDGKYRYFRPLREELFKFIKEKITSVFSQDPLMYLCMEEKEIWQSIFPEIPADEAKINKLLYDSVFY